MAQTCQSDALLTSADAGIAGHLQRDQYLYFYVQMNSTTGVTYRINVTAGAVTLYVSSTVPQPNDVRYDYAVNATVGQDGQLTITPEQLMPGVNKNIVDDLLTAYNWTSIPLYASVRGIDDNNNFTISIDHQNERNSTSQAVSATSPTIVTAQVPVATIIIAIIAGIILLCLVVAVYLSTTCDTSAIPSIPMKTISRPRSNSHTQRARQPF